MEPNSPGGISPVSRIAQKACGQLSAPLRDGSDSMWGRLTQTKDQVLPEHFNIAQERVRISWRQKHAVLRESNRLGVIGSCDNILSVCDWVWRSLKAPKQHGYKTVPSIIQEREKNTIGGWIYASRSVEGFICAVCEILKSCKCNTDTLRSVCVGILRPWGMRSSKITTIASKHMHLHASKSLISVFLQQFWIIL